MNKATLMETFALDGTPVTQRWLVVVQGTPPRSYIALRGVASGKISIHSPMGAMLTTKVCQTIAPLARVAIEAAMADAFIKKVCDSMADAGHIVVHDGSITS